VTTWEYRLLYVLFFASAGCDEWCLEMIWTSCGTVSMMIFSGLQRRERMEDVGEIEHNGGRVLEKHNHGSVIKAFGHEASVQHRRTTTSPRVACTGMVTICRCWADTSPL